MKKIFVHWKTYWLVLPILFVGWNSCSQTKTEAVITPSGLQYQVIKAGAGPQAKEGQEVLIHEITAYANGEIAFSSWGTDQSVKFKIGANQVIAGVDEGVRGMRKGEIRTLIIPPSLSLRSSNRDFPGKDSTLHYKIELVDILSTDAIVQAKPAIIKNKAVDNEFDPLYQSLDQGKTWTSFSKGLPNGAIISGYALAQNKVYIATDYDGLFVAKDGINDWQSIRNGLPERIDINAIEVVGKTIIIGTFRQGIFISNDEGQHWKPATTPLAKIPIRALIKIDGKLFAGTDDGIYVSTDQGETWHHNFGHFQVNGFTISNNKIYAAVVDGAIMSADRGTSWTYIYQEKTLHDISHDASYIYAMTLGRGLLRSNNDGQTWEAINEGLDPIDFNTLEVKSIGNQLFAAQHFGIYHSINHGNTWTKLDNQFPEKTAFLSLEMTDFGLLTGIKMR